MSDTTSSTNENPRSETSLRRNLFGVDFGQGLFALGLVIISTAAAGILLASQDNQIAKYPGLLLLIPAAISLRGNVFGAMGSRLSTAIHSGIYRRSLSPTSVMGENINASLVLSLWNCLILAFLVKGAALTLGISDTISLDRFIAISVLGGMLASVAALIFSIAVTSISIRYNWNPDNLTAPLVTAVGDLMTIPAILWSATLLDADIVPTYLTVIFAGVSVLTLILSLWLGKASFKNILWESMPILVIAMFIGVLAGYAIERQTQDFLSSPALLILLPSYLALAGSLGSLSSGRLSSKLHLGIIRATALPQKNARRELLSIVVLAIPAFLALAGLTLLGASIFNFEGASIQNVFSIVVLGGIPATIIIVFVAYYGTVASIKIGVDPDTYGIPIVTSVLDLSSSLTIAFIIGILNLT